MNAAPAPVIDPLRYVPAYINWISNKLSRGASQHYLQHFDVGIEVWRILLLLAQHTTVSVQDAARVIGMDKGSVSRAFKTMHARGLIALSLDAVDGRLRLASLTRKGRALQAQMADMAAAREQAFLSVLSAAEREVLIDMLRRLHDHLPQVEAQTQDYIQACKPSRRKASP